MKSLEYELAPPSLMILDWIKVVFTLQLCGELLPQVEEFRYLGKYAE